MPLIGICPSSDAVEEELAGLMSLIRPAIKDVVMAYSGFPEDDVLVTLRKCDVRDKDPFEPAFAVHIDTCPNEELEAVSDEMLETVANALIDLGITKDRSIEIWPKFLPGPWCMVTNGEIVDTVKHN